MGDKRVPRTPAREPVKIGNLPDRLPERLWGGPGTGEPCAVCGDTVDQEDVELELQFASEQGAGATSYHVHARCFGIWELKRRNGSLNGNALPVANGEGMMSDRECNTTAQGRRD